VGGGTAGARAQAAALAPNGVDLYVGYKASGDIMKITNATGTTSGSPTVSKIGATSDGRGVWSLVLFKNTDMYLGELGGQGLSKIVNPAGGNGQAACTGSCTAVNVGISAFPGGLAADSTYVYVGDAPRVGTNQILRWNPATGTVDVYSLNVTTYTATADGVTQSQFSTYAGPIGLALDPNGNLYVGDDPSFVPPPSGVAPTTQGHLWKVTPPVNNTPPTPTVTVTAITPTSGSTAGGDVVTITGSGFSTSAAGTTVNFGSTAANNVSCASATSCTATSPGAAGAGVVDVRVTVAGVQSPISRPADQFTYVAPQPPPTGPTVQGLAPNGGLAGGGTSVTITGVNFTGASAITFGTIPATSFTCATDTSCTAVSPAGTGAVDIQVTTATGTSAVVAADKFTYVAAANVNLWAFGITAPKGGMVFIPGGQGGHFWSSDHANGFCRQDPVTVAGVALHAMNYAVCDDGSIGSPGQAVYDPRTNPDGNHYIYVPDNAVKSTAVWRLTFNPSTESIVGAPEAMIPLADVRTLKPNGMAMGPDNNLYVTDLTEPNIRVITNPNGDPRTQTVNIVGVTGDARGANGTTGFIGNKFYISENRAATWIDVTNPCVTAAAAGGPACTAVTTPIPLPPGVFVAGVATDSVNNLVYASSSAGNSPATMWRRTRRAPTLPITARACRTSAQTSLPPRPVLGRWMPSPRHPPWRSCSACTSIKGMERSTLPRTPQPEIAAAGAVPSVYRSFRK
jgi:hypothetical protein